MCLHSVTQTYNPPVSGVKIGYKVVLSKCGKPNTYVSYVIDFPVLEIGKWYDAQIAPACNCIYATGTAVCDTIHYMLDGKYIEYPVGFHIFTNLNDALIYQVEVCKSNKRILEVEYDNVVAEGTEILRNIINSTIEAKCVVAKRLKVIKEVA